MMKIEFDPAKDASNHEKHGVSLTLAAELDWELHLYGLTNALITARGA